MAEAQGKNENRKTRPPRVKRPPTPKHLRVGFAARLRNYFLAGILVTAPLGITFWIAWNLIEFIDNRVTPLIPPRWNPETYLPFGIPGLGLVFAVLVLAAIGFLTAGFVGRGLTRTGERILARVPVVRSVYSATKQIFETVLAQKSNAFRQVCLIEYPSRGVWAVGFVTGQTVGEVQGLTDETTINVFVPATPNPTTGFLLFVPQRDVHILDMTVEEGIKLVISGGIVAPPDNGQRRPPALKATPADDPAKRAPRRVSLAGKLRNYFLAGVLITAPISITVWLALKFVSFVDSQVTPLIPPRWNPESYLPFDIPGLGLVVVFVGLTLIGMFAAGFTGRVFMRSGERILAQVPVVRSIYGAVKQILQTVLAKKSNAFRKVVLFQYPRPEVWSIGFLTGKAEGHIQEIADRDVLNVFLPTTPNPTSGFLLFVPAADAKELTMSVEEGLKMVVSGGLVTPPDRRPAAQRAREAASLHGHDMTGGPDQRKERASGA
ncbi:MAG: DUF502 domain-containing protein [Rhodospirillales bacterium]|nr:DUF502 domain-containing protein [Rhodospirillales bacterium]MDH3911756.1 DUF502 domain-containing protein [Rhodospirillales bacterium]MDH3967948.1 DUF502 domain-containing protein [Rhodospirillales bacterium]